ncbi:hypothetical protein [Wukongibacter baidiensis]
MNMSTDSTFDLEDFVRESKRDRIGLKIRYLSLLFLQKNHRILKYMAYNMLIVDCDNQANLTDCFGIESPDKLDVPLFTSCCPVPRWRRGCYS